MKPQVKITVQDDTITLDAPYSAVNNEIYRNKSGKYKKGVGWVFPDCRPVRKMLFDLFQWIEGCGIKTLGIADVDCEHHYVRSQWGNSAEYLYKGYVIATRKGRDARAQIPEDGVIIDEGGFPASGGSVKNPSVFPDTGSTFILAVFDGDEQSNE